MMDTENSIKEDAIPEKDRWENLRITNDFMFYKVMSDKDICQRLLQIIFPEMKIERINFPEAQKEIRNDYEAKNIRLDVYVRDNNERVYDIEMELGMGKGLPKRIRYYCGMLDLQLIDSGQPYTKLKESYIIFICPSDPFRLGLRRYTFRTICEEERTLVLKDETTKIILNAAGKKGDVDSNLKAFLDYVAGKQTDNEFVDRVEEKVKEARKNRKWRHEYMTLLVRDRENQEIGEERGRKEGLKEGLRKGTFETVDKLLKYNPNMKIDEVMEVLGFNEEQSKEFIEYRKSQAQK